MSTSTDSRVEFSFGGRQLAGRVVRRQPIADVRGPDTLLVVDVDGLTYRVTESEAADPDR
ncbi:hypothetical protein DVK05_09955 [Halorubrum sp. Atlit-8R]|uniref:hypothetical protein n=1 Tax=Halorubrum sp. Atlit-8R TaxID=2282126 RepID=UPI000EF28AFC|nr:hypothetical protein [Halorubrum sp. Atlit-8R]RLM81309.1 hypothetical protein DVK05_09955 [Halorubrum sp. Atlit-8R]